jgi:hypothetical protein
MVHRYETQTPRSKLGVSWIEILLMEELISIGYYVVMGRLDSFQHYRSYYYYYLFILHLAVSYGKGYIQ